MIIVVVVININVVVIVIKIIVIIVVIVINLIVFVIFIVSITIDSVIPINQFLCKDCIAVNKRAGLLERVVVCYIAVDSDKEGWAV